MRLHCPVLRVRTVAASFNNRLSRRRHRHARRRENLDRTIAVNLEWRIFGDACLLARAHVDHEGIGTVLNLHDAAIHLDMRTGPFGDDSKFRTLDHSREKWRLHGEVLHIAPLDIDVNNARRLHDRGHQLRASIADLHYGIGAQRKMIVAAHNVDAAAAAGLHPSAVADLEAHLNLLPPIACIDRGLSTNAFDGPARGHGGCGQREKQSCGDNAKHDVPL